MTRFHTVDNCPLIVQFWLLGLDAARGDLRTRGFARTPAPYGSSRYTLGPLTLHSAGLTLDTGGQRLHFTRRTRTFTLNGRPLGATIGLDLCRPYIAEHEAWITRTYGAGHRNEQLQTHRPAPPVRRNVARWQAYLHADGALHAQLWTVPAHRTPTSLQ